MKNEVLIPLLKTYEDRLNDEQQHLAALMTFDTPHAKFIQEFSIARLDNFADTISKIKLLIKWNNNEA